MIFFEVFYINFGECDKYSNPGLYLEFSSLELFCEVSVSEVTLSNTSLLQSTSIYVVVKVYVVI